MTIESDVKQSQHEDGSIGKEGTSTALVEGMQGLRVASEELPTQSPGGDDLLATAGPSSQPRSDSQPGTYNRRNSFLDLPQELRNLIYEFALTETNGLIAEPANRSLPGYHAVGSRKHRKIKFFRFRSKASPYTIKEANQIRYVCRQLHAEASGLGLKYTDHLYVLPPPNGRCVEFFSEFLNFGCAQQHFKNIRTIILNEGAEQSNIESTREFPPEFLETMILSLDSFCATHPKTTITIHLDYFSSVRNPECWIKYGVALQMALHGMDSYPAFMVPGFRMDSEDITKQWLTIEDSDFVLEVPKNVRLFPKDEYFDEVAFVKNGPWYLRRPVGTRWEEVARRWCTEGF